MGLACPRRAFSAAATPPPRLDNGQLGCHAQPGAFRTAPAPPRLGIRQPSDHAYLRVFGCHAQLSFFRRRTVSAPPRLDVGQMGCKLGAFRRRPVSAPPRLDVRQLG